MASDATLYPRYHDLMRVIVMATKRRFRRGHMRGLFEARLTRAQLLADLRSEHRYYGAGCLGSPRSVSRWLDAMQRLRFFHRTVVEHRDALGRIRWKLMQFSFGPVGIQWIKRTMPDALAGLGRSMLPKLAARFESTVVNLKRSSAGQLSAVDNSSSPPQNARGIATTPKSAALRRRTSSTSTRRAAPAPKKPLSRGGSRLATIAPARRSGRGRYGTVTRRPRRSKRAVARRRG